jgi:hypothetical protein
MEAKVAMTGKPHQSSLIPYEIEIISLRRRRPPMPYIQIADLLRQKYNIAIQAPAIFKFIKVRSHGHKVFTYEPLVHTKKSKSVPQPTKPANAEPNEEPKPKFEFKYSERYSLKRLPKDEAAAIRKKLEAEGH